MTEKQINVLLVEDHEFTRLGLAMKLENMPNYNLVAQATDGQEGVIKAQAYNPDVILMDIGLPKMDGIAATKKIKEELKLDCAILMFTSRDGIELVAQAENGLQGVQAAKEFLPDVILMDIGLPVMDGIEATRQIKELNLNSKILIFTSRENDDDVFAALAAGADGYIMKGSSSENLFNAIDAVATHAAWIDSQIARVVLSSIQNEDTPQFEETKSQKEANKKYGLTKKELEVLSLIVDGLSNQEISQKLVVSISTTKAHVHNILQKLYLSDRTKAAIVALKEGLV